MSKSWKVEKTEEFIAAYEKEEYLWNVCAADYKDRNAKQASLLTLSEMFQMPENEVKAKIHNLRAYFSRELSKEKVSKASGAGIADVYESKWPYYKSLQFLRDIILPRKSQSNMVETANTSFLQNPAIEDDTDVEEDNEEGPHEPDICSTKQPVLKRRKSTDSKEQRNVLLEKAVALLESRQSATKHVEDQQGVFGKYVAHQLRSMPEREREYTQFKIQELIFQVKVLGLNQQPNQPNQLFTPTRHVTQHPTAVNTVSQEHSSMSPGGLYQSFN